MSKRSAPLSLAILGAAAMLLTSCASPSTPTGTGTAGSLTTIRVGHTTDLSNAPIYIAEAKGYFADEGVEVQDESITSGATGMSLVAAGQIEVLQAGLSAGYFNIVQQGLALTIVGGGAVVPDPATAGGPVPAGLLVRKELVDDGTVASVADLKGLKVGVPGGPGAALAYYTDEVLRSAGLSLADVQIQNVGVADTETALQSGAIDASIGVEPFATQAVNDGVAVDFAPVPVGDGVAAMIYNTDFSSTPAATGYYRAMVRASCDLVGADAKSPETLSILSEALGVPEDQIAATPFYAFEIPPGVENVEKMQKLWVGNGQTEYTELLPIDRLINDSFAKQNPVDEICEGR